MRLAFLVLPLAAAPGPLYSQIRSSERGTVSQMLDGTVVALDYARPQVRGRPKLFGGVVQWGEIWTPGANMATTIETNRDIQLDGHPLRKGKYSVWLVVHRASLTWTLVLDNTPQRFHMDLPDTMRAVLKFPVRIRTGPPVEMLTWEFTQVTTSTMTLSMRWGTVAIPMAISVTPSHAIAFDSAAALPYLGTYPLSITDPKNVWSPLYEGGSRASVVVSYARGSLRTQWTPPVGGGGPRYANAILVPLTSGTFLVGLLSGGKIWDEPSEITVEFVRSGAGGTTLVLRNAESEVARGTRQ